MLFSRKFLEKIPGGFTHDELSEHEKREHPCHSRRGCFAGPCPRRRIVHHAVAVRDPAGLAGGIADGRGLAAVRMLGAEGVQCGTVFLSAEECHISEKYKELIYKASDISTVITGKASGHPVRSLKTPLSRKLTEMEGHIETRTLEEIEAMTAGSLRKAVQDGNFAEGTFMSGQIAGLVNHASNCQEIVSTMVQEAENLLTGAAKLV